jgi:anti-anti-sigma factor
MTHWKKLEVKWVEHGEAPVTVYHLSGLLTNSPESYAFLDELLDRVRKGHNRVVINLEQVGHITSAGVGILAACYTSVTNAGGKVCLSRVPERGRAILNVVGLLALVGECPTEEEAIRRVAA